MKTRYILASASLMFSVVMLASADAFPRGELVELTGPTDIYRFGRSVTLPAAFVVYGGEGGHALRSALEERTASVPEGLFVAMRAQTLLEQVPPDIFNKAGYGELATGGMDTIVLALNHAGDRRRWTTSAGAESFALLANPEHQADALVDFMRT